MSKLQKTTKNPALSICIPAYNRPLWLQRALVSIVNHSKSVSHKLEIIISDDTPDTSCQQVVQKILQQWSGRWRYIHNKNSLGMAQNWNQSLELATGDYVLILHDDDFLLNDSVTKILRTIESEWRRYPVLLFSVKVVNERQRVLKHQRVKQAIFLPPAKALKQVLSNSSFVRFPAIVFQRKVLDEIGYFNPDIGGIADLDMWVRLFSRYGVFCLPETTCAYTVHSQALTMNMFTQMTVDKLLSLFKKIEEQNLLSTEELRICKRLFIHQFILAGAFRFLRKGKLNKANAIMQLLNHAEVIRLGTSLKWLPIRQAFEIYLFILNLLHLIYNSFIK